LNRIYDVIIIGGGASGMIAAVKAAERNLKVLLLDKNQMLGRKLLASGNGRCNILNHGKLRYYGDPGFAAGILKRCTPEMLIDFFNHYGLMLTEEADGRMYPLTYQSASVVAALKKAILINHIDYAVCTAVQSVNTDHKSFTVLTTDNECITAQSLVVACGGCVQPKLGGSQDGYAFLRQLGHSIVPVFPSLVPLVTDPKSISGLAGIRVRCAVSVTEQENILYKTSGELLFTQYGISGICVMQCSRYITRDHMTIEIDFFQDLFPDEEEAVQELKRRRILFRNETPVSLLEGMVVDHIAYAVLKQAGIPLRGEKAADISDDELKRIVHKARHYQITVKDNKGIDFAQVTAGGADCREFNPLTMESLILPGLYAVGEVLNVDGDCGGYNLMFAFATGYIAGESC